MKHKISIVTAITAIFSFLWIFGLQKPASAVTDYCQGVATTFNATAPQSVISGQSLTLNNISAQPSTSYGVTVNSSTLTMSATNASPSSYINANSSTDPSPTTGASTYTAHFPNWMLTASGTSGSQIVVKLVRIVANVEGFGAVNCDLTATLATINIASPPSDDDNNPVAPSGSSTNQPNSGSSSSPDNTPSQNTSTEQSNENGGNEKTNSQQKKQVESDQKVDVTIDVRDSFNNPLVGARVVLDGLIEGISDSEGRTIFKDVSAGQHEITVTYEDREIKRNIEVDPNNGNTITITVPSFWGQLLRFTPYALPAILLALVPIALLLLKRRRHAKLEMLHHTGGYNPSQPNTYPAGQTPALSPNSIPAVVVVPGATNGSVTAPSSSVTNMQTPPQLVQPTTVVVAPSQPTTLSEPDTNSYLR